MNEPKHKIRKLSNSGQGFAVTTVNWTFTKAPGGVVILEFKPALNTAYIKVHCKYDDRTEAPGFDSTKATFTQAGGAFIGTMVKVYHLAQERTENYTYDAVGNRQSSSYTYEGSDTEETQTYQYYTNSDRLKTDGKFAFKYDANGNLIEKGTAFTIAGDVVSFDPIYGEGVEYWQYDYDALNRLVKVTKSGLTADDKTIVEYVYDPTGLRLMKTKGTSTTQYAFDLAGNQIYDTVGGQEHCYIWAFGETWPGWMETKTRSLTFGTPWLVVGQRGYSLADGRSWEVGVGTPPESV